MTPDYETQMGGEGRTKRQEFYLRCARLLWHDILDGYASRSDKWVVRELARLLRLSKSTDDDL